MAINSSAYNIAVAFDQNYLYPINALLTSIVAHNSKNTIHIHAIVSGISDPEREALKNFIESAGGKFSFYEVDETLIKKFILTNKWTPAVYYRLFFPLLVPYGIDRLLYLDSDTIVINDLTELFRLDLNDYPMAAVYDNYVKVQPLLNINLPGEYFNSGMLLMDINKWRSQRISEKAIDYIIKYPDRLLYVDQCALNAVLHQNWKKIDSKFNLLYSYIPEVISQKKLHLFLENKVVVHFTLQRPWNMLCKNRLRSLYSYYLSKSPLGRKKNKYVDFEWKKLPAWLLIRLSEFYVDNPIIQKLWRGSKLLRR